MMSGSPFCEAPTGTSLASVTPASFSSCSRMRLLDEPGLEKPTLLPCASLRLVMPLPALAYQYTSGAPVEAGEMTRTGAPLT